MPVVTQNGVMFGWSTIRDLSIRWSEWLEFSLTEKVCLHEVARPRSSTFIPQRKVELSGPLVVFSGEFHLDERSRAGHRGNEYEQR
jgi:hypothetical protein